MTEWRISEPCAGLVQDEGGRRQQSWRERGERAGLPKIFVVG